MHSKEKDQFLKTLADKVAQAKGQEPMLGDWDAFQTAYTSHKAQQKENKKRPVFWFTFMCLMGFAGLAFLFSQTWNKETPVKKTVSSSTYKVQFDKPTDNTLRRSKKRSQTAQSFKETTSPSLSKKAIRFEPKPRKFIKKKTAQSKLPTENIQELNTAEVHDLTVINQKTINSLTSKTSTNLLRVSLGIPNLENRLKALLPLRLENVLPNSSEAPTRPQEPIKNKPSRYIEFGGIMQFNHSNIIEGPAPKIFGGMGVHAGVFLSNHWSISAGVNSTIYYKNNTFTLKQQVTETYIKRIDTTIKFNVFYSRLMMQIDTITGERTVEKETKINDRYQSLLWSFPVQLRYHIGFGHTQLFASAGTQMSLLSQTRENKVKQSLLLAPSFGFGLNQKLKGNWWFNSSIQYYHFLGTPISTSQNFQLQTGFMFQF